MKIAIKEIIDIDEAFFIEAFLEFLREPKNKILVDRLILTNKNEKLQNFSETLSVLIDIFISKIIINELYNDYAKLTLEKNPDVQVKSIFDKMDKKGQDTVTDIMDVEFIETVKKYLE